MTERQQRHIAEEFHKDHPKPLRREILLLDMEDPRDHRIDHYQHDKVLDELPIMEDVLLKPIHDWGQRDRKQ